MSLSAYDLSAGLFVRGLTNVKTQLTKAEAHVAASGGDEATLLGAQLASEGPVRDLSSQVAVDLHGYTLAAQIHWAAQGAELAIARLLGTQRTPVPNDAKSFAELYQRLDKTIAYLRGIAPSDLEAALARTVMIEHRGVSMRPSGGQFLVAYAIPHFYYHVTTAYGILRNQGVPLTMGDFLGNWGMS